jgi:hypothetical protein
LLWSLLGTIPLVLFYLRCPFMASRYLMDFAPAFATAFLGGLFAVFSLLHSARLQVSALKCVLYLGVAVWWGYQVYTAAIFFGPPETHMYSELKAWMRNDSPPSRPLPNEYRIKVNMADFAIPFNGIGWDTDSGATSAAVALFVNAPDRLELDVAPAKGANVTLADYEHVQAKIGLEVLTLEESKEAPAGRLLVFQGPQCKIYQSGTQIAFIGFVAPADLQVGESKLRLLHVRWH